MIYAICATQLITVLCALVAVRWCIAYLVTRDKLEQRQFELNTETFQKLKTESDEALWALINQFNQEREHLIERIQHPQVTQGQAAATGVSGGASVMDDDREYKIDHPDAEDEQPTRVTPVQPVKPFGAEENGS